MVWEVGLVSLLVLITLSFTVLVPELDLGLPVTLNLGSANALGLGFAIRPTRTIDQQTCPIKVMNNEPTR